MISSPCLSWHLIILSLITLILSAGSLASYLLKNYRYLPGDQLEVMVDGISDFDQAELTCGSEAANLDSVDPRGISFPLIWFIRLLYRLGFVVHR